MLKYLYSYLYYYYALERQVKHEKQLITKCLKMDRNFQFAQNNLTLSQEEAFFAMDRQKYQNL